MSQSGEASEQVVKMGLAGAEVALKITGSAAQEVALLLIAALKDDSTLKASGKARLNSMLKSEKPLDIFSIRNHELKKFVRGAKDYGILYCALHNKQNKDDGMCDVLVKEDDSPRINRLVERLNLSTVKKARIESDVAEPSELASEKPTPDVADTEKQADNLLGTTEGKVEASQGKEPPTNPGMATMEHPAPSAPTSENKNKSARGTTANDSVRKVLREIAAQKREDARLSKRNEPLMDKKPSDNSTTTHKQPQRKGKSKKTKERN